MLPFPVLSRDIGSWLRPSGAALSRPHADDDLATHQNSWTCACDRWVNEVTIDDSSSVTSLTITTVKHYSMASYAIERPSLQKSATFPRCAGASTTPRV